MQHVKLVFAGSVRGSRSAGGGSFAFLTERHHTITRLEFGDGMTTHEAEYDTLITALEMLSRQVKPVETEVEIQGVGQLVINQVRGTWKARDVRMQQRLNRVTELLRQFKGWSITSISPEQAAAVLQY